MDNNFYFRQKKNESKTDAAIRLYREHWNNALVMSIFPYMLAKSLTKEDLVPAILSLRGPELQRFKYLCDIAEMYNPDLCVSSLDIKSIDPTIEPVLLLSKSPPSKLVLSAWKEIGSDISKKSLIATTENPKHHIERFIKWDRMFKDCPYLLFVED